MGTAKAWGLTPGAWDALDDDDKAQMMAYERATSTMQAYNQQVAEREAETQRMMRGKR